MRTRDELHSVLSGAENGDRIFDGRLVDHDRLETPFEGGVLFDVFLIFVEGRSPMQRRSPRASIGLGYCRRPSILRTRRADDGVDFIDEEENLTVGFCDFIEDRFQSFFKFAAVLGPGDEGTHVEGVEGLVLQRFRNVAADDAAGQPFDDGRFADARFPDEYRVVLAAPRQDFDGPADFVVTADDRVELILAGSCRQVAAVFF